MNKRHANIGSIFPPWKKLASVTLLVTMLLAVTLLVLFRFLLITPWAPDYLGHTLSRYLNHKVAIAGLTVDGATIYLNGLTIESPPGFRKRTMISARSIALMPDLTGMVQGKRSLSSLKIIGLSITAEKNSAGSWNFLPLLQNLSKKKDKPSAEFFVRRLSLLDASLHFNGHTIENLGLSLAGFSTKGTTESKLVLSGKDSAGNPLRLTAAGHLGSDPSVHVTAEAPAVSLAPLQQFLHGKAPLLLERAQGKLSLSADLSGTLLTVRTAAAFKQLSVSFSGKSLPIEGHLDFEARYDLKADRAELTQADLTVDKRITIRAIGSMQQVRKEGAFTLQLTPDKTDLGSLFSLLPESGRHGLSLSGEISSRGFQLGGNRSKGITTVSGDISLRRVALVREKQCIFAGGAADISLTKTTQNWLIDGKLFSASQKDTPLIESFSIPFTARLSPRFRPTRVAAPTIKAMVTGIPLKGSFQYLDSAPVPFTLNCSATDVPLTSLNGFLAQKWATIRLASGKLTASTRLSGISPQNFSGRMALGLISAAGTSSKSRISIKKAAILSSIQKTNGIFSVNGSLEASGGDLDGKPFAAETGFTLGNREVILKNALFTIGVTRIQAKEITGTLPKMGGEQPKDQVSLSAILAGGKLRSADLAASGISGHINMRYGSADRSLAGKADISSDSLTYRNQLLASGTVKLTADGRNAHAEIRGGSLSGSLSAQVNTEIFSKTRKLSFSAHFLKQKLEQLDSLFPRKTGPHISTGTADVLLNGSYSQQSGVDGTFALTAHDISLKGSSGKTLTSGIAATIDSSLHGQTLNLKQGTLSLPGGPSLRMHGAVNRCTAADRTGTVSFTMPSTPINSLLDAFANALPRNLQEASCEGSCTLAGSIELRGASSRINGNLSLESASMEIPSQKISVAGIQGSLPFSLEFPWQGAEPEHAPLSYSKENYALLLQDHSRVSGSGNRITIGSIRFGAIETGALSLFVSASGGSMRISPIEVNLYEGRLLGNGYLILKDTPEYGMNVLLNDVSLKKFCDSFPTIKGYITGRVDGILSLRNANGGLKELTGFVNLWTRTGKGEEMLVSKEFLQKLAGKKLRGFFFQNDRPYDNGEISAYLLNNYLTFEKLDISHTNFLGMKDLSVSVAPVQNRIALDHLLASIRDAAARGKGGDQGIPPVQTDLKWLE